MKWAWLPFSAFIDHFQPLTYTVVLYAIWGTEGRFLTEMKWSLGPKRWWCFDYKRSPLVLLFWACRIREQYSITFSHPSAFSRSCKVPHLYNLLDAKESKKASEPRKPPPGEHRGKGMPWKVKKIIAEMVIQKKMTKEMILNNLSVSSFCVILKTHIEIIKEKA